MEFLRDFARRHVLKTFFAGAAMLLTGGSSAVWTIYEQSVNRVEEMKVAEFNDLMNENSKFLEMLNAFTEEVGQDDKIDPVKRRELSASLNRLYTKYGNFSVNMPSTADASIKKLQTSLNTVKKQVQTMKVKSDLDPLGVSLVIMFRDMKSLKPYLEQSVGKPVAING